MQLSFGPKIAHLWGPLWLNSYGLAIAVGLFFFFILSVNDSRRKALIAQAEQYIELIIAGVLAGIVGGRILYVIQEFDYFLLNPLESFAIWDGGLSLLGSLIAAPLATMFLLARKNIKILAFLDLVTTYTPLLEGISRFGCLAAGCCHGAPAPASTWLSFTYMNPFSLAPVGVALYPTQIYSAALSLFTFGLLFGLSKTKNLIPSGIITCLYFILSGLSRFAVDFWRGDRSNLTGLISWYQLLALALVTMSIIGLLVLFSSREVSTRDVLASKPKHPTK